MIKLKNLLVEGYDHQPQIGDGVKPNSWRLWGELVDADGYPGADFRLKGNTGAAYPIKLKISGNTPKRSGMTGVYLFVCSIIFLDDEEPPKRVSGWWNSSKQWRKESADSKLTKVAMVREPGHPVGSPAPMHLNCPCGANPATDGKSDVTCKCGRKYKGNGQVLD